MKPTYQEILADPDSFVEAVFSSLESEFLLLPKGARVLSTTPQFEAAYEALKKVTANFSHYPRHQIIDLVTSTPLCLIVIRSILGFTPPEWAYVASSARALPSPRDSLEPSTAQIRVPVSSFLRNSCERGRGEFNVVATGSKHRGLPRDPQSSLHQGWLRICPD